MSEIKTDEKNLTDEELIFKILKMCEKSKAQKLPAMRQGLLNLAYYIGNQNSVYLTQIEQIRPILTHRLISNIIMPTINNRIAKVAAEAPFFEAEPEASGNSSSDQMTRITMSGINYLNKKLKWMKLTKQILFWTFNTGNCFSETYIKSKPKKTVAYLLKTTNEIFSAKDLEEIPKPIIKKLLDNNSLIPYTTEEMEIEKNIYNLFEVFVHTDVVDLAQADSICLAKELTMDSLKETFGNKIDEKIKESSQFNLLEYVFNHLPTILSNKAVEPSRETAYAYKYYEKASELYPQGRLIILANNQILYKGDNPHPDYELPVTHYYDIDIPSKFWKEAILTQLIEDQNTVNSIITQMDDMRRKAGVMTIIKDKDSEIEIRQRKDFPALEISVSALTADMMPKIDSAMLPNMSYLLEQLAKTVEFMQDKSGVHDISLGREPGGGVTAYSALALLEEKDRKQIAPMLRDFESSLTDDKITELKYLQKYSSKEKIQEIAGEDSFIEDFI